ncbi:MAG: hypothetical protein CMQ19_08280 [Gammaproteobacteria bacterium]|nr:hypothetical protein [Gammaproteobacteria bacterium]
MGDSASVSYPFTPSRAFLPDQKYYSEERLQVEEPLFIREFRIGHLVFFMTDEFKMKGKA